MSDMVLTEGEHKTAWRLCKIHGRGLSVCLVGWFGASLFCPFFFVKSGDVATLSYMLT